MKITSKHLEETAKKATGWLASQMTPLGNYKGNQAPDKDGIYPDTDILDVIIKVFIHCVRLVRLVQPVC